MFNCLVIYLSFDQISELNTAIVVYNEFLRTLLSEEFVKHLVGVSSVRVRKFLRVGLLLSEALCGERMKKKKNED